jgi:hemolysin activation/secretion protein
MYIKLFLNQRNFLWPFIAIFICWNNFVVAAQMVPDTGQLIQELKKQPNLNQPGNVNLLSAPEQGKDESVDVNDVRMLVNGFKVSGSSLFDHTQLESLVSDLVGGQHNFAEISAGVARITQFYRQRGFMVARAYLPEQDLKDGIVQINILEGQVGARRFNNTSHIADTLIEKHLDHIKTGVPLEGDKVDRAILLLSDTPGVGGARATLQPGASVGTSDLVVQVDSGKPYYANIELDNYGSYYTGENRLGAAIALNSPLNLGDQLTVRALTSDRDLTYARLAYLLPVGGSGFKLGAAYTDMRYTLGREYKQNDFHGTAVNSSVYATYPLIRTQLANLYTSLTFEHKDFRDVNTDVIEKKVRLFNFGFAGSRQDTFLGGGFNSFETSIVTGRLSMDDQSILQDRVSADTKGTFAKLNLTLNRLQRINDKNTFSLGLSIQAANKNLNSSEKFYLGGATGVRAFPQSEAGGDEGWMINAELRHDFNESFQGIIFYDAGAVHINHNAYLTDTSNIRNISGAGLGINARYKALQFKSALSWRVDGGRFQSVPQSEDDNVRLWMQVGGAF